MNYRSFTAEELTPRQRHQYILGTVNPRPICFASTLNKSGQPNLAPYSFFNVFSSTPPIFIFSSNTRRDGSSKDTLYNVRETGEVVINLVSFSMARQMAICGVEYDATVNEFEKSGFTPIPSEKVSPFRVKEAPVQYECKVLEVRALSEEPGAANLIMAQAVLIHMREDIFAEDDTIDYEKIDMVGRLGNFNYCRANYESVFAIKQPPADIAIGFDNLPEHLKNSTVLTGYQLGILAGVTQLPARDEVDKFALLPEIDSFLKELAAKPESKSLKIHQKAQQYLQTNDVESAWKIILQL